MRMLVFAFAMKMDKFSPILVTLSLKLLLTATTNKNLRSHFSIPCKDKPNQQLKMMLFAYLLKNTLVDLQIPYSANTYKSP